jgi:hypothetical protein
MIAMLKELFANSGLALTGGENRRSVGAGNLHPLIVAPPEEE